MPPDQLDAVVEAHADGGTSDEVRLPPGPAELVDPVSGVQVAPGLLTAVVTAPAVLHVALAILTVWAVRRRLHNLAWAVGLTMPLVWGTTTLAKTLASRPRPPTALPLITAAGWGYPSAHLSTLTALIVLALAALLLAALVGTLAAGRQARTHPGAALRSE